MLFGQPHRFQTESLGLVQPPLPLGQRRHPPHDTRPLLPGPRGPHLVEPPRTSARFPPRCRRRSTAPTPAWTSRQRAAGAPAAAVPAPPQVLGYLRVVRAVQEAHGEIGQQTAEHRAVSERPGLGDAARSSASSLAPSGPRWATAPSSKAPLRRSPRVCASARARRARSAASRRISRRSRLPDSPTTSRTAAGGSMRSSVSNARAASANRASRRGERPPAIRPDEAAP